MITGPTIHLPSSFALPVILAVMDAIRAASCRLRPLEQQARRRGLLPVVPRRHGEVDRGSPARGPKVWRVRGSARPGARSYCTSGCWRRSGDDRRRRAGPAELHAPWQGALDRASRHLYSYARRSANDPDRWPVQVLCRTPRPALPNQASPSAGHVAAVGLRGTRRASDSLETRFRHHQGPRIGTPAARRSRKRRGRSAFVRAIEPHCVARTLCSTPAVRPGPRGRCLGLVGRACSGSSSTTPLPRSPLQCISAP